MALSKKSKALLLRARVKAHPILLHKTKKLCKESTDTELLIIFDSVKSELKKRGLTDE